MVTEAQVGEALAAQKESGLKLGEMLVQLGYVTEGQMTQVLSNQLSIPWVNLYHVDFSRELLGLVPAEVAEAHCLVPVYVRHVRRQGDTLYVAMEDPTNVPAMQEVADGSGLPVKPMVASPTDIKNAIRVYYLGLPPLGEGEASVELDVGELAELELASTPPAERVASEPAPAGTDDDEEEAPALSASPSEPPKVVTPSVPPGPRPGPGFLTLTLLDGTQVKLPAARGRKDETPKAEERLTTRDLIHALVARAGGADVSDILPDDAWEPLMAALLSVLLRKGLIADWEFVDEWNKQRTAKE
ncbi:MAG: hypothetical protein KC619_24850 [Myxococcales bacterium]|nr:hypothetical protein [Myxococcales bacterium]